MEVNDYLPTHVRVFSDASGSFNPEILKDVLHLDLEGLDKGKVSELLNANQTEELSVTATHPVQCPERRAAGDFEKLGGYTEMLLPNNILKQDSVLARLVRDIDEETGRMPCRSSVGCTSITTPSRSKPCLTAEKERQNYERENTRRDTAFHAGLDCAVYGGKLPWSAMAGALQSGIRLDR